MTWRDLIVGGLVLVLYALQYLAHERRIGRLVRAIESLRDDEE